MTTPIGTLQPGEHIQRVKRGWTDDYMDQHGRRFAAQYELANGRPIGEFQPVGFNPPWLPPMRYIIWERPGGFRFRWDYETLANEFAGGSHEFYTQVAEFMVEHMAGQAVPEDGEPIPAKVRRFFKAPPLSPAIPLAAQAGDPWILGEPGADDVLNLKAVLDQTINANGREALERIRSRTREKIGAAGVTPVATLPEEPAMSDRKRSIHDVDLSQIEKVTYQQFLAAALKGGMSMADAALAWQAHKNNVAAETAGAVA